MRMPQTFQFFVRRSGQPDCTSTDSSRNRFRSSGRILVLQEEHSDNGGSKSRFIFSKDTERNVGEESRLVVQTLPLLTYLLLESGACTSLSFLPSLSHALQFLLLYCSIHEQIPFTYNIYGSIVMSIGGK